MNRPDASEARAKYKARARVYDRITAPMDRFRERLIDGLDLKTGETVIDVACGTGANFAAVEKRIGSGGRVIGVDLSTDMLEVARRRVEGEGWQNVALIASALEDAELPHEADVALFSLTHDVLQSRPAVANVMGSLREGGRVGCLGSKWGPRWNVPLNIFTRLVARNFVTTLSDFDRPWHLLDEFIDLEVRPVALGSAYLAWGTKLS